MPWVTEEKTVKHGRGKGDIYKLSNFAVEKWLAANKGWSLAVQDHISVCARATKFRATKWFEAVQKPLAG